MAYEDSCNQIIIKRIKWVQSSKVKETVADLLKGQRILLNWSKIWNIGNWNWKILEKWIYKRRNESEQQWKI